MQKTQTAQNFNTKNTKQLESPHKYRLGTVNNSITGEPYSGCMYFSHILHQVELSNIPKTSFRLSLRVLPEQQTHKKQPPIVLVSPRKKKVRL